MVPSQTVENYLKTIFQAQIGLAGPDALVPMGQLATAIGVVPGTATTMVKALADSGLAHYEPYAGVRLTAAGEKLAALVLRRHRLIELFLVKVMGMSWIDVHDEAENLEHAMSDRLVDRIDEMLGRPDVDPHGDPIPDSDGVVPTPVYDSLLTCPLDAPMTISRVSDQDREFLEFAEKHDLRPGDIVRVENRSVAGDSVRLRARDDRPVTIGARAASKVLVKAVQAVLLFLAIAARAYAQTAPSAEPKPAEPKPFEISDNSFLVEEAFNQEKGVFQNIFGALRSNGGWTSTFTQEWPLGGQKHQFSYTAAFLDAIDHAGIGDTLINYRYQALLEGPGRPAFSPRLSLVVPSGDSDTGLGDGSWGLQVNLPFSKQRGDWYLHWNAGLTWLGDVKTASDMASAGSTTLTSPFLSGSAIYRLRPMFHLMLESVTLFEESLDVSGKSRNTTFTLSPGFRGGWNIGEKQLVAGFALPVSWTSGESDTGAFLSFSYESPFTKNR
jgi:DtxR family transcriptional regulator, Mn-dependent transcriptional regulator